MKLSIRAESKGAKWADVKAEPDVESNIAGERGAGSSNIDNRATQMVDQAVQTDRVQWIH